jgi:hypothetical protein
MLIKQNYIQTMFFRIKRIEIVLLTLCVLSFKASGLKSNKKSEKAKKPRKTSTPSSSPSSSPSNMPSEPYKVADFAAQLGYTGPTLEDETKVSLGMYL